MPAVCHRGSRCGDWLHEPVIKLSVAQQQRLCFARTLALDPEVILMDEPTSSLDAKSTEAIEQQILRLRATRTLVLVTHNQPGRPDRGPRRLRRAA